MPKKQPKTETQWDGTELDGLDQLNATYALMRNSPEDFTRAFSYIELGKLARAYRACAVDYGPHLWHPEQVKDAISYGLVPTWDEQGHPVLPMLSRGKR